MIETIRKTDKITLCSIWTVVLETTLYRKNLLVLFNGLKYSSYENFIKYNQCLKLNHVLNSISLRKRCPNRVSLILIFPHLDWILLISPYSVQMRVNTDQKNSKYVQFSRSVSWTISPQDLKNYKELGCENWQDCIIILDGRTLMTLTIF